MNKYSDFKKWLEDNTNYTKPTISNIVSRLKRADGILPLIDKPVYIFELSRMSKFSELTVSVKSQIRRAIKLYFQFKGNEDTNI